MDQTVPFERITDNNRYRFTNQNWARKKTTVARARGLYQPSSRPRGYSSNLGNYKTSGTARFRNMNTRTNPRYPRPEIKVSDVPLGNLGATVPITNTGSNLYVINGLDQGTAAGNRVGQQVATKSCYYQFVLNFGTTTAAIVVRHLLIWDRQPNGVAPVVGDILSQANALIVSPLNLQNRDRFTILADDRTTLSPQGDGIRVVEGFRNINQLTTYPDDIDFPTTGALIVLFLSDEPTGASAPTFYGVWRIRYIDN